MATPSLAPALPRELPKSYISKEWKQVLMAQPRVPVVEPEKGSTPQGTDPGSISASWEPADGLQHVSRGTRTEALRCPATQRPAQICIPAEKRGFFQAPAWLVCQA